MDTKEAIKRMLDSSGMSAREASKRLGKSPNYLSATLAHGGNVTTANLARIASALGWTLVLARGDERMEIGGGSQDEG